MAVLRDKQTGVVPAGAMVFPNRRSQFWQGHSLRHLAEPLAAAEAACKMERRHPVRQHGGDVLRHASHTAPSPAGVLTVTGLGPSPLGPQEARTAPASQRREPRACPTAPEPAAEEGITHLVRHPRSLLTRTGRPPVRLAGMATSERLEHRARCSLDLLATPSDPRLAQLYRGLRSALCHVAQTSQACQQGAAWLRDSADI